MVLLLQISQPSTEGTTTVFVLELLFLAVLVLAIALLARYLRDRRGGD